jgi:hypothetical protein
MTPLMYALIGLVVLAAILTYYLTRSDYKVKDEEKHESEVTVKKMFLVKK